MNRLARLASSAILAGCIAGCAGTQAGPPRVDHIRIEVSDMKASIAFYHGMIGLPIRSQSAQFSWLQAGNMGIALSAAPWSWTPPRPKGEPPGWGMYPHFQVPDVEALAAKIKAAGYQIVQPPEKHSFGTEAFVADPDGYVWALVN